MRRPPCDGRLQFIRDCGAIIMTGRRTYSIRGVEAKKRHGREVIALFKAGLHTVLISRNIQETRC